MSRVFFFLSHFLVSWYRHNFYSQQKDKGKLYWQATDRPPLLFINFPLSNQIKFRAFFVPGKSGFTKSTYFGDHFFMLKNRFMPPSHFFFFCSLEYLEKINICVYRYLKKNFVQKKGESVRQCAPPPS